MEQQEEFQERVVSVSRPQRHFVFLTTPDGAMLGLDDRGSLVLRSEADDRVIWDWTPAGFRHVATGKRVSADLDDSTCLLPSFSTRTVFSISHGPERLPSEYLDHLRCEGWVCLSCILPSDTVCRLQRVAGTDAYEHLEMNNNIPKICQDVSVGRSIAEPVSLWLIRQYIADPRPALGASAGLRRTASL